MRTRHWLAVACALLAVSTAWAQAFRPFVVKDIRVEGLQRTEPGTVFSYLPVKVGGTMNEEKAQAAIRALFATGFFRDVRLEVENDVLVVLVEERPSIAQLDFSGFKEFDAETLRKVLRELGIAEGRTFDPEFEKMVIEFKRALKDRASRLIIVSKVLQKEARR